MGLETNKLLEDTDAGFQIPPGTARVYWESIVPAPIQAQVPLFLGFKSKQGQQLPTNFIFRKLLLWE